MDKKCCQCILACLIVFLTHPSQQKLNFNRLVRSEENHRCINTIAKAIQDNLSRNGIDLANCRGQSYDATTSMSSDKKGVQAEMAKFAPNAEYQGCCLHSLNLVIYHACSCKEKSIGNMMDSCQERNSSAFLTIHQNIRSFWKLSLMPFCQKSRSVGGKICAKHNG